LRYTGGEKKEEHKEAVKQVQGLWEKTKDTFSLQDEPQAKGKAKTKGKK
jgi:hypothetical protein